jgi:hypothetical protein
MKRLLLAALLFAPCAAAEEIYLSLEAALPERPELVADAAPRRLVLMDDGTLFVGGTQHVASGRLEKREMKDVGKRLDRLRKAMPGLSGTISFGAEKPRYRLVVSKGKAFDVIATGDPAAAPPNLKPLASLVADLAAYQHPSLRPYKPAFYALRAKEASLAGGCREWTFPVTADKAVAAAQSVAANDASGWPTGALAASACVNDKRYAVTLRPLLPFERP